MRKLPSKAEILREAQRIELEDITLPSITPTPRELKESSKAYEARLRLMRNPATEALLQQRKYLDQMAGELNLGLIPKRGLSTLRKETGYEWTNGWTKHEKRTVRAKKTVKPTPPRKRVVVRKPSPAKVILGPKPKRRRNHSQRVAVIPRALRTRIKNGQKSFSFSDDVWKVRKRRRR